MANNPNSIYKWSINKGAQDALSFLLKAKLAKDSSLQIEDIPDSYLHLLSLPQREFMIRLIQKPYITGIDRHSLTQLFYEIREWIKGKQEYSQWYKILAQMVNQLRYLERVDR